MADEASEVSAAAARPVEVVDVEPRRVRRPLDLVRVVVLALVLALIVGLGTLTRDAVAGANSDVTRLIRDVPHLLVRALNLVGTVGALVLPVTLVVRELVRSHLRRLIEGLVTGLVAIGVVGGLDLVIATLPNTSLRHALTTVGHSSGARPLDAYLAALLALAVVVGIGVEPLWRALFWVGTGLYMVSAFAAAQASLLTLMASLTVGAFVATAARYVLGSTNVRPGGARLAEALNQLDLRIAALERSTMPGEGYRTYLATDDAGGRLHVLALGPRPRRIGRPLQRVPADPSAGRRRTAVRTLAGGCGRETRGARTGCAGGRGTGPSTARRRPLRRRLHRARLRVRRRRDSRGAERRATRRGVA